MCERKSTKQEEKEMSKDYSKGMEEDGRLWRGGEGCDLVKVCGRNLSRSACTSNGYRSSALVLALVRLGSARTAGRCSCAAIDDRAGGGRYSMAPTGLALISLPLRLVKDGWRARRFCRAPSTTSPLMLVMERDNVRLPEAV